jgi:PPOX class probable F420-dependent enzyme
VRPYPALRAIDLDHVPAEALAFLAERHLATLTTLRPDGSPHVTPVGFSYDPDARVARIITFSDSRKVANLQAQPITRAAVSQVDGGRWLTLEGPATVTDDADRVARAVAGYAVRYRTPGERPDRVAIEIAVDHMMGRG